MEAGSERKSSVRERKEFEFWSVVGRRRGRHAHFSNGHYENRPATGVRAGNRGVSRLPSWRGPREPPLSGLGQPAQDAVSLFVDGISWVTSSAVLWDLFEKEGAVSDVYISGKVRKNTSEAFGFVRFVQKNCALRAIKNLDGFSLHGHNLRVSMARYQKGGNPVDIKAKRRNEDGLRPSYPTVRNQRRYSEMLYEKQSIFSDLERMETKENQTQVTLNFSENHLLVSKLNLAAVVEFDQSMDFSVAASMLTGTDIPFVCISALSPSKMALFFENESSLLVALEENATLRKLFTRIRRWSDMECCLERRVWLECVGLNPKCWSMENIKKIGDIWGKTIFHSLTSAKVLVQTKIKHKIETTVQFVWESGSGEVLVKEVQECECWGKRSIDETCKVPDGDVNGNIWQAKGVVSPPSSGLNGVKQLMCEKDKNDENELSPIFEDGPVRPERAHPIGSNPSTVGEVEEGREHDLGNDVHNSSLLSKETEL
ncbi:unnamed protein product [Amaranthus hypochondriacus]